jgi:hypothetical protein
MGFMTEANSESPLLHDRLVRDCGKRIRQRMRDARFEFGFVSCFDRHRWRLSVALDASGWCSTGLGFEG